MELNPYRTWTVNIATSIEMMSGILAIATNRPARMAKPPKISSSITIHAVATGAGAPIR